MSPAMQGNEVSKVRQTCGLYYACNTLFQSWSGAASPQMFLPALESTIHSEKHMCLIQAMLFDP